MQRRLRGQRAPFGYLLIMRVCCKALFHCSTTLMLMTSLVFPAPASHMQSVVVPKRPSEQEAKAPRRIPVKPGAGR